MMETQPTEVRILIELRNAIETLPSCRVLGTRRLACVTRRGGGRDCSKAGCSREDIRPLQTAALHFTIGRCPRLYLAPRGTQR